MSTTISPAYLIVVGLTGVVTVNVIVVTWNLIIALRRTRGVEDPEQVEAAIAPALMGVPSQLGPGNLRIVKVALWVFLGIAALGAFWAVADWVRNV